MKRNLGVIALSIFICGWSMAQEESVNPGVNDNFVDPDVDRYVELFEGESRSIFAKRHEIVKALGLKPGMAVGDIGAGTGFFSLLFSDALGATGQVYAVEIAQKFVDHIEEESREHKKKNIKAVLGDARSVKLPAASDAWTLNHVRCSLGTVIDEVQASGFDFVEKIDLGMEDQYVIRFVKRGEEGEE